MLYKEAKKKKKSLGQKFGLEYHLQNISKLYLTFYIAKSTWYFLKKKSYFLK